MRLISHKCPHHFQVLSQRPTRTAEIVRECVKVSSMLSYLDLRGEERDKL